MTILAKLRVLGKKRANVFRSSSGYVPARSGLAPRVADTADVGALSAGRGSFHRLERHRKAAHDSGLSTR